MIVHHNPHILEFMEIFDEAQIGPVLYRAFLMKGEIQFLK